MLMIARHGQTIMNVARCVGGPIDSPLTPAGIACARLIGQRLAKLTDKPVLTEAKCSPSGRALSTCELICEAMPWVHISVEPRIAAVDSGEFNGLPVERVAMLLARPLADIMSSHDWFFGAPGGETFDMVWDRCDSTLRDLPSGTNLLVTHGLPARFLRCIARGLSRSDVLRLKHPQTTVSLLSGDIGSCEERTISVAPDGIADALW